MRLGLWLVSLAVWGLRRRRTECSVGQSQGQQSVRDVTEGNVHCEVDCPIPEEQGRYWHARNAAGIDGPEQLV